MPALRNYCDVAPWTVDELIDACHPKPSSRKARITIPEYQRRLVWSQKKQDSLIDSIKSGHPFGSLLLYGVGDDEEGRRTYRLIDGLQRTHAILRYVEKPTTFAKVENVNDSFAEFILRELGVEDSKSVDEVRRSGSGWRRLC